MNHAMDGFKRPNSLPTTPARQRAIANLLDQDDSVFSNISVGDTPKKDTTPKHSNKRMKIDQFEDWDLFADLQNDDDGQEEEEVAMTSAVGLNTACVGNDAEEEDAETSMVMEQFEMELDEHCDFTLMQFVQSSQAPAQVSTRSIEGQDTQFAGSNTSASKPSNPKTSKSNSRPKNPLDLLMDSEFPDIQSQQLNHSLFERKGSFYGLPDKVKKLIEDHKGIKKLYDWQDECLNLPAISSRQNLIYALPTSSGKTLVAEILIFRELACQKRDVLFILPFVSIVKEKIAALAPFAVDLNFYLEEYAAGQGVCPPRQGRNKNSVYIATIEKSMALVNSLIEVNRVNEIGLVVVDELHLLGEPGRGAILETVLTKVKYTSPATHIIGMSATIGNLPEIELFLDATTYRQEFRPVELKEYIKCGKELLAVEKDGRVGTMFVPARVDNFEYDDETYKIDQDHLGGLVMEVAPKHALLIFCPVKKNCQDVAINLTRVLKHEFLDHRRSDKMRLMTLLRGESDQICEVLKKTVPYGVAYHHSGLTVDERRLIEDAYRAGVLCVICCTSTLAAGVNLPAQRVIIRSPYVGREFLTQSRYKQMIGRAGRAGFDVQGESFLIVSRKDKARVHELIESPMTDAISSMHLNEFYGLRNLILSAIGLKIASTMKSLKGLAKMTFLAVQADRLGVDIKDEVEKTIKSFFKQNALAVKDRRLELDLSVEIEASQFKPQWSCAQTSSSSAGGGTPQVVVIRSSSELEISPMGRAAVKACVDLKKARFLYDDLRMAQRGLVLLDHLHLLYIVTPPDVNIYPKMSMFYDKYNKLTADQLHTARMIGITENLAVKIVMGKVLTSEQTDLINRFFVTLILQDLWNLKSVFEVSQSYSVNRGLVQNLVSLSASYAVSVSKFCQEIKEFWAFEAVLSVISSRLRHCCTSELIPLMELPSVRLGRAKQLYAHGFKTIEAIARADPQELMAAVEFLSKRQANQIVSAAIVSVKDKMEVLQGEVDSLRRLIGNI